MEGAVAEVTLVHGHPSCPLHVLGAEGIEPAAVDARVGIRGHIAGLEGQQKRSPRNPEHHRTQSPPSWSGKLRLKSFRAEL